MLFLILNLSFCKNCFQSSTPPLLAVKEIEISHLLDSNFPTKEPCQFFKIIPVDIAPAASFVFIEGDAWEYCLAFCQSNYW
jgi:hypothetical protein